MQSLQTDLNRRITSPIIPIRTGTGSAPDATFTATSDEGDVLRTRRAGITAKIEVQPVREHVSMLKGSGGNIAVLHGAEELVVVDAGLSRANIWAALQRVDSGAIRYLVNTHWHFDHTDGNEWMHADGATIVAHKNTRSRLSTATRVDAWNFTFPPSPVGALPEILVLGVTALHINDTTVTIEPYGPSHTDTDVRVAFTDVDVLCVGDTWWNGDYPFIDYSTGGSIDGMIRAAEENVRVVGDDTLIIPGHGPVGGRKELTEFRDLLRSIRDVVAALKKDGKSVDEVVAAKPTAKYDAEWGNFWISPDMFTRLVYAGV